MKKTNSKPASLFDSHTPSNNLSFDQPFKKAEKKEKVVEIKKEKRENRVSGDKLKPLSSEERKKRFPNGAISLKQLKLKKSL